MVIALSQDNLLDRPVGSGILVRAARGAHVYRLTRHFSDTKSHGTQPRPCRLWSVGVDAAPAPADQYRPSVVRSNAAAGGARKEEAMLNPSLTRRINALPDTLSRLMSDPAVSESMARADESKRRLTRLLPLDGVEQSAIDEYRRDWLARYVYNSNAIEGSTLSLKDTELVMEGEFVPTDSPARYIFAARGVADGMAYVEWFVDRRHPLDIDVIRKLHEITAVFRQVGVSGSRW